mmetsp:Transcript_39864/g.113847  ORF Transcript_39864/g.113847 Transcript_39864/m.113847 type:complete len:465 (+) Transcript_39864:108-1502(+)
MSWRDQSTFKPSSAYLDDEKEVLKLAKRIREALKLAERQSKGEALERNQLDKIAGKNKLLDEVARLAAKLPSHTEVFEKNGDILELLPASTRSGIDKKRHEDQVRRERREVREVQERKKAEFMSRHEKPIVGVAVSDDCKYLYTCAKDKYVLCWSLSNPLLKCVCTFAGHSGAVMALDIAGPSLISGDSDGKLVLWPDPSQQRPCSVAAPASVLENGGIVKVLHFCPFEQGRERRFVTASDKLLSKPPVISVWRLAAGRAERLLQLDKLPTRANDVRWAKGGASLKLFSAHDNGYVGVWQADAPGTLLKTIRLHEGPVTALCLTPDGTVLLTASHDCTAKAVDISTRDMPTLATYKANRPLRAVTASADFKAGESGAIIVGGGRAERDITTSKDLVSDEFEGTVLDAESGQPMAAGTGHIGPVHAVLSLPDLGPDGAFATISEDACLRVHGVRDGRLLFSDTYS